MTTRSWSFLIGVTFLAVGLLGFIANPIIGMAEDAIFHADSVHNIVHIVSGALFLLVALIAPGATGGFNKLFGLVYLAIGIAGLVQFGTSGMGELFGFLHVNGADNFLHVGLGVFIFLTGFAKPVPRTA